MESIIQFGGAILAATTIVTGILKLISTSKITRIEKSLLTDYKKTLTTFLESVTIVFALSFAVACAYISFNDDTPIESAIAIFLASILYSSVLLWITFNLINMFKKKTVRYFIIIGIDKYYLHKSISEDEIIISPDVIFNSDSSIILIRKREFLCTIRQL